MSKITSYYRGDGIIEATIGKHRMMIDKPRNSGGYDRGPTPIELFIASLGTCVAMVIGTYCEEHSINADDLQVDIRYQTNAQQTRITDVTVNIEIPYGDIEDREQAIARVAKQCSVHKTIQTLDQIEFTILGKKEIVSHIW